MDRQQNGDIKSLQKGKLLLESGRVLACSMLNKGDALYFSGIVAASMKKRTSYCFQLKLNNFGEVINSDCECAAGKGPHCTCKHVAAICYFLITAKCTGKILLQKSCTSQLQNFHHPKTAHSGNTKFCA